MRKHVSGIQMYEILCLQRQHLKPIEYNIGEEINKEPYAKSMAGSLTPYPTFDYASDKSNAGPRWERWVSRTFICGSEN